MDKYIYKIVRYAFIETQIYGYSPLTCIYYLSLFDKYCEVEVRSLSELVKSVDLDNWIPDLVLNYSKSSIDKNIECSLSYEFVSLNSGNNGIHIKPRFLRKKDLLYESIILSNKKLPDNICNYWVKKDYGRIACSYNLSAGVDLALVPELTMIELLKFTNKEQLKSA